MSAATMNGTAASQKKNTQGSGSDRSKQQSQSPAPKAWSGQNPSTLRASSTKTPPVVNGTDKPLPSTPQQFASPKSNGDMSHNDKHAHDRALFLLANFVGQYVTLSLKNGEQFTGIFGGASFDSASKQQYTLKMTKMTRHAGQQVNGHAELASEYIGDGGDYTMTFDVQDTSALEVQDVKMAATQPSANGSSATSSFRTDTEISGRGPVRERELQRWSGGDGESLDDMALGGAGGSAGWDQFAVNEQKYGVQSTYNEDFYTTAINRNDPNFRQREAYAARLAAEIEGSSSANAHTAEERRRDADQGDGLDEEERYSGVRRETVLPKRAAGAYVPPSQRPITSTPTVRGAPFDPAIISTTKPAADKQADAAPATKPATSSSEQAPTLNEPKAASPAPPAKRETTAEDHIRNTTDAFKQFANNEKLKIRQTQESKRQAIRNEKSLRLNDLKKFAANFKLKSRVPDDLVPILAKDHEKQQEIQKRADDAAKEEEVRATERAKQKTTPKSSDVASPMPPSAVENRLEERHALPINHRARVSGNLRGPPVSGLSNSRGAGSGRGGPPYGRQTIQPLPENLKMPGAPAAPMQAVPDAGPLSPGAAKKLNVNARAFEFRPGANAFTPTGTTPSPQRNASGAGKTAGSKSFLSKKKVIKADQVIDSQAVDALDWPRQTRDFTEDQKRSWAANGGQAQPYRPPPTWGNTEKNANTNMKDALPRQAQAPSQGPSPMHTPGPNMQPQMPHSHQLPPHMQQGAAPPQRGQYLPPQPQAPHPGQFDPRMAGQPMYGPNGSVQNSPRFPHAQMAYGPQMSMPQFGGQPGYGMSPSMYHRQPNMQPANTGMPMMQPRNQGYPPMPSGPFPGPPPQFHNPQMPGQPPFMNGAPHQGGGYGSPMPPHAQPQHMGGPPQGPYGASPRPGGHMMQHTNSHQGFQGGQGIAPFAPSPAHHPMHMGPRQYSHGGGPPQYGGHPHMTPRQGHAMPHPQNMSPMGGMPPGEEGK